MTLDDIYDKRLAVFDAEINQACAVAKLMGQFMNHLRDMPGYEQEFYEMKVLYCKCRVKLFERTLAGVDDIKKELPQLYNHNDFIIQLGTWQAELVEAREELRKVQEGLI
jgi:hypothetical protein